jgi:hypothetical protein
MEKSLFTISGQSLYPAYRSGDQVEIHPIEEVKKLRAEVNLLTQQNDDILQRLTLLENK